jgi:nucleotide-binding universal stress UspA family protein
VLYATDLSSEAPAGARLAVDVARASGARLTILNVLEYHDFILWGGTLQLSEAQRTTIREEASSRIGRLMKDIDCKDLQVETVVTEGKPYQKVLYYADHNEIDLIVLNLQGKTLIERAALGSTAERVVRLANSPVLSVPAIRDSRG